MCSVCLQNPCDSRCPNAPEPKPVCLCSECNEGIYEGDKYLEGVNGPVCTTCSSVCGRAGFLQSRVWRY